MRKILFMLIIIFLLVGCESKKTIQEQVKEQILEDMPMPRKKIMFPSSEISIFKNETEKSVAFDIINYKEQKLKYKVTFKILLVTINGETINASEVANPSISPNEFDGESSPRGETNHIFTIYRNGSVSGTFFVRLTIEEPSGTVYSEKTFFVTIE